MNLRKIAVATAFLGAVFSLSQTANAGLFDDLNKMQKDLEKLQGGIMPKAPSAGGNATGFSGMSNMGASASGGVVGCVMQQTQIRLIVSAVQRCLRVELMELRFLKNYLYRTYKY